MATADNHTRRPWIAVLLSLFCTGLGHVYCGRFVKGFVLYTIYFFFMPLVAISALRDPALESDTRGAGFDRFISKLNQGHLLRALEALCAGRTPVREA